MRVNAKVTRFTADKGYGFAAVSSKHDVFICPEQMRNKADWEGLEPGDMLSVEVDALVRVAGARGKRAAEAHDIVVSRGWKAVQL